MGTPGPKCSQAHMLGPIQKKKKNLAVLCSRWDLSSLTRDCICAPARKHRALTTGPPGKSHDPHFNIPSCMLCTWGKHQSPLCIGSLKGSLQGHRYGNKIVTWDKCPAPSTSVQFSSITQWCPTLRDPMDCSTPGFPVYHQPLELAQTHVH